MNNKYQDDLSAIRGIMEDRTRFISLSGLSGILAGVYALIGAYIAYRTIYYSDKVLYRSFQENLYSAEAFKLFTIALLVLVFAIITGIILSYRKAKKQDSKLWNKSSKNLIINMLVPLITGGVFILFLIFYGYINLIASASLIFYGLALYSAGNYTFSDVKNLGIAEILLGMVALFYPGFGLFIWAVGFGILHILYGAIMYYKYE